MQSNREARIRERAYQIWNREGRGHGSHEDHWRRAEREIAEEAAAQPGKTPARSRARAPGAAEPKPRSRAAASVAKAGASKTKSTAGASQRAAASSARRRTRSPAAKSAE